MEIAIVFCSDREMKILTRRFYTIHTFTIHPWTYAHLSVKVAQRQQQERFHPRSAPQAGLLLHRADHTGTCVRVMWSPADHVAMLSLERNTVSHLSCIDILALLAPVDSLSHSRTHSLTHSLTHSGAWVPPQTEYIV